MSHETNIAAIRRLFDECWNQRNLDGMSEVLAPDYAERERDWASTVLAAFPDTHFSIESMLADGDRVATHVIWRATHLGTFAGTPPTGKHLSVPALFIHRMEHGKAVESWGFGGAVNFVDQITTVIRRD